MAVNQPPIVDDQALNAWYFELVRQINQLEALVASLESRIKELEDA